MDRDQQQQQQQHVLQQLWQHLRPAKKATRAQKIENRARRKMKKNGNFFSRGGGGERGEDSC